MRDTNSAKSSYSILSLTILWLWSATSEIDEIANKCTNSSGYCFLRVNVSHAYRKCFVFLSFFTLNLILISLFSSSKPIHSLAKRKHVLLYRQTRSLSLIIFTIHIILWMSKDFDSLAIFFRKYSKKFQKNRECLNFNLEENREFFYLDNRFINKSLYMSFTLLHIISRSLLDICKI